MIGRRFASLARRVPCESAPRPRASVVRGRRGTLARLALGVAVGPLACLSAAAQPGGFGPGGLAPPTPPAPREAAPVDLTGYWVSIVTEDWIERMAPDSPPSGSGGGFGRGAGGAQRPVSNPDEPCRVYGAGGSMRMPGRVHISWADDRTLRLDLDAGSQRRLFHFEPSDAEPSDESLQGYSVASWETGQAGRPGGFGFGAGRGGPAAAPAWGKLKVVTTHMTGGYLLSSRSSYTDNAVLTEYFSRHAAFGNEYLTVTAILEDGGTVSITSSTLKKEPDGTKFEPTGCDIRR